MVDYYKILGVPKSAGQAEIRAAYKRQAMVHHPDHNPGQLHKEELFKIINEAYHVLSDPIKRVQYDQVLQRPDWQGVRDLERARADHLRKIRNFQMQQYLRWKRAGGKTYDYRVDKEYFRIMGITLAVFALIASLSLSIFYYSGYLSRNTPDEKLAADVSIQSVEELYREGHLEESLRAFHRLRRSEQRRYETLEQQMMGTLYSAAGEMYAAGNYPGALRSYLLVYEFETIPSAATWGRIGLCKMGMGQYEDAEAALRMAIRRDYRQESVICLELAKFNDERAKTLAEQICNDY